MKNKENINLLKIRNQIKTNWFILIFNIIVLISSIYIFFSIYFNSFEKFIIFIILCFIVINSYLYLKILEPTFGYINNFCFLQAKTLESIDLSKKSLLEKLEFVYKPLADPLVDQEFDYLDNHYFLYKKIYYYIYTHKDFENLTEETIHGLKLYFKYLQCENTLQDENFSIIFEHEKGYIEEFIKKCELYLNVTENKENLKKDLILLKTQRELFSANEQKILTKRLLLVLEILRQFSIIRSLNWFEKFFIFLDIQILKLIKLLFNPSSVFATSQSAGFFFSAKSFYQFKSTNRVLGPINPVEDPSDPNKIIDHTNVQKPRIKIPGEVKTDPEAWLTDPDLQKKYSKDNIIFTENDIKDINKYIKDDKKSIQNDQNFDPNQIVKNIQELGVLGATEKLLTEDAMIKGDNIKTQTNIRVEQLGRSLESAKEVHIHFHKNPVPESSGWRKLSILAAAATIGSTLLMGVQYIEDKLNTYDKNIELEKEVKRVTEKNIELENKLEQEKKIKL